MSHEVPASPTNSFLCHTSAKFGSPFPLSLADLSHNSSSKCQPANSLRALVYPEPRREISWLSFCISRPLFSMACGLFSQNTRGGGIPDGSAGYSGCASLCGTSAFSAPQRYHLQWFGSLLCFHNLTNPSFSRIDKYVPPFHKVTDPSRHKLFLFTSIQNPGGVTHHPLLFSTGIPTTHYSLRSPVLS
jgi:hypothetical protein